jgi:threonyl-tRNA synthetase
VGEVQLEFTQDVARQMLRLGIRAEVDLSGDRLGKLIRNAEKDKIPVMAVVGAKEVETNSLNIRTRSHGELGAIAVDEVVKMIQSENLNNTATASDKSPADTMLEVMRIALEESKKSTIVNPNPK